MVTEPPNRIISTHDHENVPSDEEADVTETTPLIRNEVTDGSNAIEDVSGTGGLWRRPWSNLSRWSSRDAGYALLFSVPFLLLIPSLVFFVMTMNLRASLPPSSSLEIINNLTHRVEKLTESFDTCKTNSSRLATSLHDAEQRVEVCRTSERRLAERVDVVERMLDTCRRDEAGLKQQLSETQGDLNVCIDDKEELKRQMESGVFVQFLDMVGKMGTGGDSWVCSDATLSWSHGYTTTDSPHPTITIESWSADLDDAQHSTAPLVFPPPNEERVPEPVPTPTRQPLGGSRLVAVTSQKDEKATATRRALDPFGEESILIVGYTVNSLNTSGNNGWWRITKLPAFAVKGSSLEFFAQAAKWYGSSSRFKVTVYWVGMVE